MCVCTGTEDEQAHLVQYGRFLGLASLVQSPSLFQRRKASLLRARRIAHARAVAKPSKICVRVEICIEGVRPTRSRVGRVVGKRKIKVQA